MMTPFKVSCCRRFKSHANRSGGAMRRLPAVFRGPPVRQAVGNRDGRGALFSTCPLLWRRFAGMLALLVLCLFPLASGAEEKILSFVSAATVFEDASLEVRVDISVNVEGRQIRRGIYRDFPTKYTDSTGRDVTVGFSVKGALRGGREVPYSVRSIADGVRIYLGDPNRRAPIGKQTYTLVYVVTGALGFFDEHDELYWNVTGNGWAFTIDEASFSLSLPGGARPTAVEFFTGWQGARGQDAQQLPDGSVVTTGPLPAGEGLTVVFAWPKGIVSPQKSLSSSRSSHGITCTFWPLCRFSS